MGIKLKKAYVKYKRFIPMYLMMVPGMVYVIVNNYIPLAGLRIAFQNFNYALGVKDSPYVWFDNFEFLFATSDAYIITRNTICYNAVFIVLGTAMAVGVSILLNEIVGKQIKKVYQTAILVPFLISMVVVSYLAYAFLSTDTGFINNSILAPLGLETINWYSTVDPWPVILVIVNIWKYFGYNTIIYYATLVGIDGSYYEAAAIDGATRWQQVKHITMPCLTPTIITLTLMAIGRIFFSDFGLFFQVPMDSGILLPVTNTIDTYVYRGLFTLNNISMAAAAGVYQSVVGFILVLTANCVVRKINADNALF